MKRLLGRPQRQRDKVSSHRGVFSRRADQCFLTLEDGRRVFYPMGSLGRLGYILNSPDQELVLATRLRESWWTCMFVAWITSMVVSLSRIGTLALEWGYGQWLLAFISLWVLGWAQAHLSHWRLTRSMERTRLPNTTLAHWRAAGRTTSPGFLVFQGIVIMSFIGIGLYMFGTESRPIGLLLPVSMGVPMAAWIVSVQGWWRMRTEMRERSY